MFSSIGNQAKYLTGLYLQPLTSKMTESKMAVCNFDNNKKLRFVHISWIKYNIIPIESSIYMFSRIGNHSKGFTRLYLEPLAF